MERIFPFLAVVRNYKSGDFRSDLIAGLTVGVMLVPQGMAYAMIAGLPPVYGLYASIFPPIIYAFFGTSRQLAVGPVAMDSLLVATGVSTMAVVGSEDYISLAILLALMIGVIQVMMGTLRLGFLTHFLSRPVIAGFTNAAVLIIAINHIKYLTGIDLPKSKYLHEIIIELFARITEVNFPTLVLGLSAIVFILVMKKVAPRVPAGLTLVMLGVAVVYFFDLEQLGVAIVGFIPDGLPEFSVPEWSVARLRGLLPMAFTLAFIGYMEAFSIAKTIQFKRNNEYEVRANQELVALGVANVVGSMFSSFTSSASFSRSAVNNNSGAKSTVALVIAGVVVSLVLLFLTPVFYYLPSTVLAAIVIVGVISLLDIKEVKSLWYTDRVDFTMLAVAFVGTIALGVEWGIILGVLLSLAVLIYKTSIPHMAELGQIEGTRFFRNIHRFQNAVEKEEVSILRFDARLYFANVDALKEKVASIVRRKPDLKLFILDSQSISDIDSMGINCLREIQTDLQAKGVVFKMSSVIGPVRDKLQRTGLSDQIGLDNLHPTIESALGLLGKESIPFQANI
ncbi:SulP family inorganic anion transporter [Reichenbachiella ulvae]|uniref:Sulfate permease n=1 Tax=Reichenbachiella ulvae TaxID=2980104 RepID=A0ABT3CV12_9BACT|nr:sulfate permease [Reichenbachiella ulvae]MCV9387535.1 sulfate permease [Reichenbachiella ulvae]